MNNCPFTLGELCDRLAEKRSTLILFHVRADADAVGSAFALRAMLEAMGSTAYCLCSEKVPDRLRFLYEDVQGTCEVPDGFPLDYERVITVDSASPSQVGKLFDRVKIDFMIDHHSVNTPYADGYIDGGAAATGEILFRVAKELTRRQFIGEMPKRVYDCLYAAISSDTGGFRYANTTPETHRAAAELIGCGVDGAAINHLLFTSKSPDDLAVEGEAMRRVSLYEDGKISVITFPYSVVEILGAPDECYGTVIDIARSVAGSVVAVSIRQSEPKNEYRVSLRSQGPDVALVAAEFGGGGHSRAAGCTVTAGSADEAEDKIVTALCKRYFAD